MKKILLACAGFAFAFSFLWAGVSVAANVRSGQSPRIMSDEVIDGTLYAAGNDIKMEGVVQGDLMCAGQNIEITGTVQGDVLCAGQTVTVNGHVEGDIRVAGQVVAVKGKVEGSATVLGQTVTIDSAAHITRDATLLGQQVTMNGTVHRDVEALGSTFTASGHVGRDLDVTSPVITLAKGADVAGMFMYVSKDAATIDSEAKIAGKTEHKQPPAEQSQGPQVVTPAMYLSSVIFSFSSFFLIGAALLLAAPRVMRAATHAIATSPLATLGTGFVALFMPPFAALALFITGVGFPLGLVVLMTWVVSLLLGVVFSAQVVGRLIVEKLGWTDPWNHFASLVTGLFAVFLAALVPFVGPLVVLFAVIWGAGSLYYVAFTRRNAASNVAKEAKKNA